MRAYVFIVLSALMVSAAALAADAPVRIAILSGDGDRAVDDATMAQLEVALTENKEITLLERAQVSKILAEQKLSAAGLTDPATAVKLGKLLSVEMLLFIEQLRGKEAGLVCGQVVETRTGICLVAEVFEGNAVSGKALP